MVLQNKRRPAAGPGVQEVSDPGAVLTKAVVRAADRLGLSQQVLAQVELVFAQHQLVEIEVGAVDERRRRGLEQDAEIGRAHV